MLLDQSTPDLPRISDYVHHYALATPEAPALMFSDQKMTYAAFAKRTDQFAKALINAGVSKGDRIAMLTPPHPNFAVSFFAAASIGAIWVGLNPRYKIEELSHVVGDAQPVLLFARKDIEGRNYHQDLASLKARHPFLRTVVEIGGNETENTSLETPFENFLRGAKKTPDTVLKQCKAEVSNDDPALIIYTSGTTGRPKGALIAHRGLVQCARIQRRYWNVDPLRVQNFLPINHIGCVGDITCYTIVAGGAIFFSEKFDPRDSLESIGRDGITLWGGIPTTLQMSVDLLQDLQIDLSSLQMVVWSGAPASASLVETLKKISSRLSNAYGMTETVGSVTFVDPCNDIDVLCNTVGRPVPEYEFRIEATVNNGPSSPNEGEILVRSDYIMIGYWNNPKATADAIDKDGWLHTGDIGRVREDGNVELVGRKKEMFKSGGYNIYPREIELALENHPGVAMAAVIGVPDQLYGEIGYAFIIASEGDPPDSDELKTFCRKELANYKIPKKFLVQNELPLLPVGKIDKQALKKRLHDSQ